MEKNEKNPKVASDIAPSSTSKSEETELHPDGGWGWLVTAGCFIVRFIKQLVQPCFGILFYDLLLDFGTSSATIGWVYNLHILMDQSSKFFAGPLGDTIGWRKVVFTCGLLASASIYGLAYATNVSHLFLFFSVIGGSTLGLSTSISHVIVPHYFKKNLGKAMAIVLSGVCLGHFVGPLLITFLLKHHGYKGTVYILTGVALSICLAASVFRPVNCDKPKSLEKTDIPELAVSKIFRRVYKSSMQNFVCLKSWQAILLAYSISSFIAASFNFVMLVSFILQYRGYTIDDVAWTLSIVAICNAVARISCSFFSDWAFFNKRYVYTSAQLGLSIIMIGFIFLEDLIWLQCAGALYGLCCGSCSTLYSFVMLDALGLKMFKAAYGLSGIMSALASIAVGPSIGWIKDLSGSYKISIGMVSLVFFTGFLSCALLPFAAKRDEKKLEASSDTV